ncbi:TPA: glycosyltransferase family 25 protein, partial [Neisseria meningitidis]
PYLSGVEKACFMSHTVLWKQALDESLPYIAVFEDDVLLGEGAEKFLAEDGWLKERFDPDSAFIVRLETMFMHVLTSPSGVADYCGRAFPLLESEHWGTAGYIISRKAMRFFLDRFAALPSEGLHPVDWMMFGNPDDREGMPVCQLNPALCAQELHYAKFHDQNSVLGSLIEHDRCLNRKQQRRDSPRQHIQTPPDPRLDQNQQGKGKTPAKARTVNRQNYCAFPIKGEKMDIVFA